MRKCLLFCLFIGQLFGQSNSGVVRLKVVDPSGLGLQASVEIVSEANQFRQSYVTDQAGALVARNLPFGLYRVEVKRPGFGLYSNVVEIRSAISVELRIQLSVAPTQTAVEVRDSDTLVDPHRTGTVNRVGSDTLDHRSTALPGRSIIDLVNSQPGWVLESNGVLHPRGSEYQTQYIVDGIPLTDNRSPSFAPEIEADDAESVTILTANFPAEYGRKLGGVVEISTARDSRQGLHGKFVASGGSFGTADGYLMVQQGWVRTLSESVRKAPLLTATSILPYSRTSPIAPLPAALPRITNATSRSVIVLDLMFATNRRYFRFPTNFCSRPPDSARIAAATKPSAFSLISMFFRPMSWAICG